MALIRVEGAKLSFGSKVLFDDVTFSINEGDRVALVGNNGCGKSSLVKVLMGQNEFDRGSINKKRGMQIGYVSQEIPEDIEGVSCYDYLLSCLPEHVVGTDFWKVDVALADLELDADLWHKPINLLSGGWRRLLLIAGATLKEPDLLILDEPTNHLDLGKIFKLEKWLKEGVSVPYLIISHDREFLDKCTDKTLFMRGDGVHTYSAPFSIARENLLQSDVLASKTREREELEIKRLERAAVRLKEWGSRSPQSSLSKKGEVMQSRADTLRSNQTETYKEKKRDIALHYDEVSSNSVLSVQNTIINTPDGKALFKIDRFSVKQGERVCVLGLNGTGKSVFIREMIEKLRAYEVAPASNSGFWFSPQVRLGYLDQHLESLPGNVDMYKFLTDRFSLNHTQAIRELVHVGFPPDRQNTKIDSLSSGEKARLALLVLKLSKPNFYILDEPTNHLDIQGQEDLEDELDDKGHTCIFVSHDRRMIRGAATRYVEIKNGKMIDVESPEDFFERLKISVSALEDNKEITRRHNGKKSDGYTGREPK